MLKEEDIQEFQNIYKQAFGKEISSDEARKEAAKLIDLTRIITDGLKQDINNNNNFIIEKK